MTLNLSACSPAAEQLARHEHSGSRVQAAAISHSGRWSFVATNDDGLMLIDNQTGQERHNWQQDDDGISQITSVAIAYDETIAVAASRTTIALWNINTGNVMGYWRNDQSSIRSIAVANAGRALVFGRSDGVVVYFEPNSGRRLEFYGHSERINHVDVSANGRYVLSGGDDHQALLWDAQSGQVIHRFASEGRVGIVRLEPQGRAAFTASARTASIWRLPEGELQTELNYQVREKSFISAAFSPQSDYLVTGSPSRHVEIWRTSDGKQLASWRVNGRDGDYPPRAAVIAVAIDNDNLQIISESSAGFGERWDARHLLTPE